MVLDPWCMSVTAEPQPGNVLGQLSPWVSPRCQAPGHLSNRGMVIQALIPGRGRAVTASGIAAGEQMGPLAIGLGRIIKVSRSPGQGLPITARDVYLTAEAVW